MQFGVYDDLSAEFMGAFYAALVAGKTIDEAVAHGRAAIRIATINNEDHLPDWGVPVLYLRAPGGAVFNPVIFNPVSDLEAVEAARQAVDHLVVQDVGEVSETGLVKGVEIGMMKSDRVRVRQSAEDVNGVMIGGEVYRMEGGNLVIDQKFGTVSGSVTGLRIGTLGGPPQPQQDEAELIAKIEDWYRKRPAEDPPATEAAAPEPVKAEPKKFNPAGAAAYLGIDFSEADVIAAIEAGDLKARKFGPKYLIHQQDLDELLGS
jgi:hypothetical protein